MRWTMTEGTRIAMLLLPDPQPTVGPSNSTKSIDADRDIRSRKPLGFIMTLAVTTSVIIAVAAGHMLTAAVEPGGSVFALTAILAYESYGAAAQIRYYLLPRRHFAPFLAVAAGPLWKKTEGGTSRLPEGPRLFSSGGPIRLKPAWISTWPSVQCLPS
jgi:hypothetical protein